MKMIVACKVVCKVILTDACSAATCTELKNATREDAVHSTYDLPEYRMA